MSHTPLSLPAHVPPELVRDTPYIFGSTTSADPFGDWPARLHEGPRIFYAPNAGPGGTAAWVPTRATDLQTVYLDTETFSSEGWSPFAAMLGESWSTLPLESDPPRHSQFRRLVMPLFSPKAVNALDEKMRTYATQFVDRFADNGACEFMNDFAFEFPIRVMLELMGLPVERAADFLAWEHGMLHGTDFEEAAKATRSVVDYLRETLERRKQDPTEDAIGFLAHAHIDGRDLTDDERLGFAFNVFSGGLDAVSANMGHQILHLARSQTDQQRLRADPGLIPDAVDEMLRAFAQTTTLRVVTRETVVGGVTMMPGDHVALMTTLGTRDPDEHEAPHEIRFDRKSRYLTFGYGVHNCVGLHLTRHEIRVALRALLERLPSFRLEDGVEINYYIGGTIQPVEIPLV